MTAQAGNRVWTGSGPRAKSIEAVVRDPLNTNRVWAAAFGSGVYRSLDGGTTWTGFRSGLLNTFVRCLAVEPKHPDSVFCGTNDGVYLSVDGGTSWSQVRSTSGSVRSLNIHPIRTGVIYAAVNGSGVYKSVNGGKNWSAVNLGLVNLNARDLALHPTRPETLLVGTGTGGGIHRSFNGGLSWTQVADTTASLGACEQIQFDPLDPLRIYAAELDRGVIRSTDGGVSWARINNGLPTLRMRSLLVVDTLRYAGTDGFGVFVSSLNSAGWNPASTGLPDLIVDALAGGSDAPRTVWAGTDGGGIARTTDGATSWTSLDGGLLNTFGFSLAVRPATHAIYDGCGFGDQFWTSVDGAASWTRASYLFTHDSEHGLAVDPLAPLTLYVTAYGAGVYRSLDDGRTFRDPDSLNHTLTNLFVRDLVAVPGVSGHLFVGSGNGVFETLNGGALWTARSQGLPTSFSVRSLAIAPGPPLRLYAGSDSAGVYRSVDGGLTWVAANAGIPVSFIHALLVDQASPLTVYAATDSGVYKSTNGAVSWFASNTGFPLARLGRSLAQDPAHPNILFCGLSGVGVFESENSGFTWHALFNQLGLPDLEVRSLVVDGALTTVYVGTEAGVSALSNYPLTSGTAVTPGRADLALALGIVPNPAAAGRLSIRFNLPDAASITLEVFDIAGARIRLLARGTFASGPHRTAWDGRDDRGRSVPAGVYLARIQTSRGARTARLVLLRE